MAFRKFNNIEYPVPGVDTAIQYLRPGCKYDLSAENGIYNFLEWQHDSKPPTKEEIQAELLREVGVYEYYVYERNREKQYPDLKEQLDMLYHDIMEDNLNNGKWIQTITAIKESNPKPDKPEPEL
tara:strand:+ start:319 stop:693 length:375 start_codon:yes stop_codon:yes gene_type:complete